MPLMIKKCEKVRKHITEIRSGKKTIHYLLHPKTYKPTVDEQTDDTLSNDSHQM